jgi:flagellar hook-length control protein FliK
MQITQQITAAQPPGIKKQPENSKASPDMFTAILSALQLQPGIQAGAAVDVLSSETCPDGSLPLPGADLCQYSELPYDPAGFTLPEMAVPAVSEPCTAEAAAGATIYPVPVEQIAEMAVPAVSEPCTAEAAAGATIYPVSAEQNAEMAVPAAGEPCTADAAAGTTNHPVPVEQIAEMDVPDAGSDALQTTKTVMPQVQTDGETLSANSADGLDPTAAKEPVPAAQEAILSGSETAKEQAFTGIEKVHLSKLSKENGSAEPSQKKDTVDGIPPDKSSYPVRAALETPAAQFGRVNVARAEVVEQVMEKMVFSKDLSGESSVFIRLKPAVLGQVEIRLSLQDGQLTASIMTGSTQVKEALEGAMAQIRQRLESQQIHVAELTVFVGEEYGFTHGQGSGNMYRQNETQKMHGRLQREGLGESPGPASVISGLVNTLA